MAFTVNKKAFCDLEFARTESIVTVQRRFRIMYHTEPPTDNIYIYIARILTEWCSSLLITGFNGQIILMGMAAGKGRMLLILLS